MGEKNMFKKPSKLFDREGFYIVLFVCLCIVAVTAVYISRNNANNAPKKAAKNSSVSVKTPVRTTDPVLTQNQAKTVTTSKQQVKSTKDVAAAIKKSTKKSTNKSTAKKAGRLTSQDFKIAYPVKGEIVKKFDNKELQESKAMGQWETHEGIDIACEPETQVKAAASGKVVEIITNDVKASPDEKNGFGVSIIIDHGNNYRTMYSNLALETLKVKKGDSVKADQVIGYVGDTSVREATSIEGSHLHFEVLKKSKKDYVTVDPAQFLK